MMKWASLTGLSSTEYAINISNGQKISCNYCSYFSQC